MKTILEQFELVKTDRQFVDRFDTRVGVLDEQESNLGPSYNSDLLFADEYRLAITIGTLFRANKAMYAVARQQAEQRIVHGLFEPVLDKMSELRSRIYAGDREGCLKVLHEMHKIIGV